VAESSPGRKPGVRPLIHTEKPRRGDRPHITTKKISNVNLQFSGARFAGLQSSLSIEPRAYARGYFLPPLRGSLSTIVKQLTNQDNKNGRETAPAHSTKLAIYSIVDMLVDVSAPFFGRIVLADPVRILENPDDVVFGELGIFIIKSAVGINQSELFIYLLH